jgi:serine/threonine protein phosphatase PrpC
MEDAHATILSLPPVSASGEPDATEGKIHPAFFAVYDGHGGEFLVPFRSRLA